MVEPKIFQEILLKKGLGNPVNPKCFGFLAVQVGYLKSWSTDLVGLVKNVGLVAGSVEV